MWRVIFHLGYIFQTAMLFTVQLQMIQKIELLYIML